MKIKNCLFESFDKTVVKINYEFKLCYEQYVRFDRLIVLPRKEHAIEFLGFESLPLKAKMDSYFAEIYQYLVCFFK